MQHISTPERWLPVVGYEGFYEVSDHGRVRSVDRMVSTVDGRKYPMRGVIRRQNTNGKNGYYTVTLNVRGTKRVRYVHQLVLEAFIGPRPEGMEARHLDDVREHNFVGNLVWGTRSENNRDMVRNGGHHMASRTHCDYGHEFTPENTYRRATQPNRRACRECGRATAREWNRKARAEYRAKNPIPERTHCKRGHEFSPENTYVYPSGSRSCRECKRNENREFMRKKRKNTA